MHSNARFKPRNLLWFTRFLRWSFGAYLKLFFRIKPIGAELFKELKGPFVLVPNHQGNLDPFMVGSFVPRPVYWVTSDGNMRSTILKFLLRLVGSIPKSKAIPDLETVNWIVDVIRRRGGVVGVFAEGTATWDGRTLPLIPSTAKLVKLLKVPVVAAVMRGGYYSQPRWSWKPRRGYLEIEYKLIMDGAEAKAKSADEVLTAMQAALAHDEAAWAAEHPHEYRSRRMARHLELSLFMCPRCGAVGGMRSHRDRLYCRRCGYVNRLGSDYRFSSSGGFEPRFPTISAWSDWQEEAFRAFVLDPARPEGVPILSDAGVMLLRGRKMNPLLRLRTGTMCLYRDRVELTTLYGRRLAFPLDQIEGEGVLKHQRFEFYLGRALYQFRFPRRWQSGRKWLMAVGELKAARAAAAAAPDPAR